MTPESATPHTNGVHECVVCGKEMSATRASATFFVNDRPLPVCCRLCLKLYEKDPEQYATRATAHEALRDAEHLLGLKDSW